jgi:hypothetical protein
VQPLSHRKIIVALAFLSLIVSIIGAYSALPKRYSLGERLVQTNIFWSDKEAFFFPDRKYHGTDRQFRPG